MNNEEIITRNLDYLNEDEKAIWIATYAAAFAGTERKYQVGEAIYVMNAFRAANMAVEHFRGFCKHGKDYPYSEHFHNPHRSGLGGQTPW